MRVAKMEIVKDGILNYIHHRGSNAKLRTNSTKYLIF